MKNKNGITLIALVITIIVMLVLVAVTLSIALGQNGLIAKAKEAKISQDKEQDKEILVNAYAEYFAEKETGKLGTKTIATFLPENWVYKNEIYISPKGNKFIIDNDGTIISIDIMETWDGTVENAKEIARELNLSEDIIFIETVHTNKSMFKCEPNMTKIQIKSLEATGLRCLKGDIDRDGYVDDEDMEVLLSFDALLIVDWDNTKYSAYQATEGFEHFSEPISLDINTHYLLTKAGLCNFTDLEYYEGTLYR